MTKNYNLVIKDAQVVDAIDGVKRQDIGITGEHIERLDYNLHGQKEIVAKDCFAFAGFIDPHVHLRDEEWDYKEDFLSGTRAAINGGVVLVADMPNVPRPVLTLEDVRRRKELATQAKCDVVFYGGVTKHNLDELERMAPDVCGYKIYVCESTGNLMLQPEHLYHAFRRIENTGRRTTIHCEDQTILDEMKRKRKFGGLVYPHAHCDLRPASAEIAAIKDVLSEASDFDIDVNIAHISTAGGLKLVEQYQKNPGKARVTCEVTPHHLYYTSQDMSKQGDMLKMNPPLRSEANRKALFDGLANGSIYMLATDHAPHTKEDKRIEKPSGIPNLDDYGRFVSGLIDDGMRLKRIAEVTSLNPAVYLGLQGRGKIQEGAVADLAIIEPNKNDHRLYTKCGWSPYERERFPGDVAYTIFRGKVVKENGRVLV